jgi:hypothetical protein
MKKPATVKALEDLGRVRLSPSLFMRDFLHSEIANLYGMPNIPDDADLAIDVGTHLCVEILEPLQQQFGRVAIRSAFRSCSVNQFGNEHGHSCARNETNYGARIWDRRNAAGHKGAMACVAVDEIGDGESRRAARRCLRDSARSGGNGPADAVTVPSRGRQKYMCMPTPYAVALSPTETSPESANMSVKL